MFIGLRRLGKRTTGLNKTRPFQTHRLQPRVLGVTQPTFSTRQTLVSKLKLLAEEEAILACSRATKSAATAALRRHSPRHLVFTRRLVVHTLRLSSDDIVAILIAHSPLDTRQFNRLDHLQDVESGVGKSARDHQSSSSQG